MVGWYRQRRRLHRQYPGHARLPDNLLDDDGDLVDRPATTSPSPTTPFVEDDYNDVETYGARAALRIDLNDNWTVTPQIMAQKQVSNGTFAEESGLGELEVHAVQPREAVNDKWYQAALTVEGKIGNFDLTYAGAYMQRQIDGAVRL